jgi:hypothetical protein
MNTTQIKNINRMNRASASPLLGQVIQDLITSASSVSGTLAVSVATLETNMTVSSSHVVSGAEATASAITIQTTVSPVVGKIVQATRSGSQIYGVKCLTTGSNLNITSASPSLWVIAADDAVNYIVW